MKNKNRQEENKTRIYVKNMEKPKKNNSPCKKLVQKERVSSDYYVTQNPIGSLPPLPP